MRMRESARHDVSGQRQKHKSNGRRCQYKISEDKVCGVPVKPGNYFYCEKHWKSVSSRYDTTFM
jgi:hypothetical protein